MKLYHKRRRSPDNGDTPPERIDQFEGRGQTILFVDDDIDIADMCSEGLEILGYEVVVKYSGVDALDYFKQNPGKIDLVVTDQTMPHMTGKDLGHKLLAIEPSLPVILCSGYSGDVNEKKAGDIGILRFIMKPFTVGELSKIIQEVFG